ncbi:MAG: ABC transporter ATP-binding protein, partial [Bacillota bacterium]|nr:ABC transporter ATP-binding protein [Bacillota bacterium]
MSENKGRFKNPRREGAQGGMGFGPRMGGGEKARNFKGTMKKLIQYLSLYKLSLITVFIFAIASAGFSIVGPKILGKATTKLFEGAMKKIAGTGTIDFDYIGKIIVLLIGLYLLSSIFGYVQGWIMSNISMKVSYRLRKEISEKINRMPFHYFDETNQGEVLSRVTNDVDTLSQTLNQSLGQIISSVTTVIGVLIMMISISFKMTLVALATIPVSMILILLVVKNSQKYFKQQQNYLGNVNGHVEEMYGAHTVIKAFNGEAK